MSFTLLAYFAGWVDPEINPPLFLFIVFGSLICYTIDLGCVCSWHIIIFFMCSVFSSSGWLHATKDTKPGSRLAFTERIREVVWVEVVFWWIQTNFNNFGEGRGIARSCWKWDKVALGCRIRLMYRTGFRSSSLVDKVKGGVLWTAEALVVSPTAVALWVVVDCVGEVAEGVEGCCRYCGSVCYERHLGKSIEKHFSDLWED